MDEKQFYESFLPFLDSINLDQEHGDISPSTNLLEAGYIDSLKMVELIIYLEELLGEEIAIEEYHVRKFYSMGSIYQTFIEGKEIMKGVL